jgi:hypothetical protein
MDHVLAYIDAGSGSLIIQVMIASALAIPFFMRAQIRRGLDAIRGVKPSVAETVPPAGEAPATEPRVGEPGA